MNKIRKEKLPALEKKYASYLEAAGVFTGGRTKPEPTYKMSDEDESPFKGKQAISHNGHSHTPVKVKITKDDEREEQVTGTMTKDDAIKYLGLEGT